jgi:hypothetical protein
MLAGASVVLLTSACDDTREIEVNHYRQSCSGMSAQLCYLTRDVGEADWSYFYDGIDGFEFEWGHSYRLTVIEHTIANPPADGSSVETTLEQIVDDQVVPAGTTFNFNVAVSDHLIQRDAEGQGGQFTDGKLFICDTPEVCDDLDALLSGSADFEVVFQHADDVSDPLIVVDTQE